MISDSQLEALVSQVRSSFTELALQEHQLRLWQRDGDTAGGLVEHEQAIVECEALFHRLERAIASRLSVEFAH